MGTDRFTLRVLIVDDFEPVRRRLARMLVEEAGIEVVGQTGTVEETLAAVQTLAPDVVILDLILPDGNGLDVLRRTLDVPARPRFIVLTSFVHDEYREAAERYRAHAFLDKARDFDRVVESIHALAKAPAHSVTTPEPDLARPKSGA
jgi:DNA-binding NarL/FixJ family response regulator